MNNRRIESSRTTKTVLAAAPTRISRSNASISSISNSATVVTLSTLVTLLAFAVALDTNAGRRSFPVRNPAALASIREFDEANLPGLRGSLSRRIAEAARDFLGTRVQQAVIFSPFSQNQDSDGLGDQGSAPFNSPRYLQRAELVLQNLRNLPPPSA